MYFFTIARLKLNVPTNGGEEENLKGAKPLVKNSKRANTRMMLTAASVQNEDKNLDRARLLEVKDVCEGSAPTCPVPEVKDAVDSVKEIPNKSTDFHIILKFNCP